MSPSTSLRLLSAMLVVVLTVGGLGVVGLTDAQPLPEYDAVLDSDGTAWQGQRLYFDGTRVVQQTTGRSPSQVDPSQREFAVRLLRTDNTVSDPVHTVTLNRSGTAVISTTGLDGRYVLTYDGRAVAVDGGDGSLRMGVSRTDFAACSWLVTDDPADVNGTFDQMTANGTLVLDRTQHARLSGRLDLVEGSEITIRIHGAGTRPFLFLLETRLGPDGQFTEAIDLGGMRNGTPVDVTLSFEGRTLVGAEGVVGDETQPTTSPASTAPPQSSTATTPNPTTTTSPGFDLSVTFASLVGAGVLTAAVRQIR